MRRTDTLAERREFLERVHLKLFNRRLDELNRDTLATVLQTMADAAVLSDEDVLDRLSRTREWVDKLMEEEGVGDTADERKWAAGASYYLLQNVLQRELMLRGLGEDGEQLLQPARVAMNGEWRREALEAAWAS